MTQFSSKSVLVAFALVGMLTALGLPTTSQPVLGAVHTVSADSFQDCKTLEVILHGSNPPTVRCVESAQAGVGPNISGNTGCNNGDLFLYDNLNRSGDRICFAGNGTANLTDFPHGLFGSWNDALSSYDAGSQSGRFYWDTNSSGSHWDFTHGTWSNFGGAWDNQVSSLCINNTSGAAGCP